MWRRFLLVSLLLLIPQAAQAQEIPERLLPGGSQIYVRWDGVDKHQANIDKTNMGRMLKDDTGKFLAALWTYGNDLLNVALTQADPKIAELVKDIPPVLAGVHHHGILMAVEVRSILPPDVEGVIVFPKAGGPKSNLVPLLDKLAKLTKTEVKQTKVGKRMVYEVSGGPIQLGWWQESGDDLSVDVVLVVGTSAPKDRAKAIETAKDSYALSKNFAALKSFKEFPTWAQGYLDVAGLLQKIGDINPAADQIIGELGLKGLQSVTFHSGFAGDGERSVVEINTPQTRKGLLALMNRKPISLTNLPKMPNDITSFSASNFNVGNIYEGGITIAQAVINVFFNGAIDPKEAIRQAEGLIGVKFGEDLFGSFDDMFVTYSSPAENPLGLGTTYLFKVKNEKKLGDTLDSLFKSIPPFPGFELLYKKTPYRGGDLMELKLKSFQGEQSLAYLTIHKGWFILASYPQSIYGFILRNKGDLPVYKLDDQVTKALTAFPKEYTSIAVSDPRPAVQALLSIAPTALTLANTILPNVLPGAPIFDVTLIPHPQAAVRHLSPNITVTTDDGKKIRMETRASMGN